MRHRRRLKPWQSSSGVAQSPARARAALPLHSPTAPLMRDGGFLPYLLSLSLPDLLGIGTSFCIFYGSFLGGLV